MNNISKKLKSTAFVLAVAILFGSCSSTTVIRSNPSGAKLYLNGEAVGTTPYTHTDTKIVTTTTKVKLVKDGYKTLETSFSRDEEIDVGAIIGGVFFFFPYAWAMKYYPEHLYDLEKEGANVEKTENAVPASAPASKAERLREFKKLLDEKIITQEEFDKEKQKILDEK